LIDPRDQTVRYVGKTTSTTRRLRQHVEQGHGANVGVQTWIDKLVGAGLAPQMIVLGRCELAEWEEAERAWIAFFRERGRLHNIHAGGRVR